MNEIMNDLRPLVDNLNDWIHRRLNPTANDRYDLSTDFDRERLQEIYDAVSSVAVIGRFNHHTISGAPPNGISRNYDGRLVARMKHFTHRTAVGVMVTAIMCFFNPPRCFFFVNESGRRCKARHRTIFQDILLRMNPLLQPTEAYDLTQITNWFLWSKDTIQHPSTN